MYDHYFHNDIQYIKLLYLKNINIYSYTQVVNIEHIHDIPLIYLTKTIQIINNISQT